jgi:hypothetical protein
MRCGDNMRCGSDTPEKPVPHENQRAEKLPPRGRRGRRLYAYTRNVAVPIGPVAAQNLSRAGLVDGHRSDHTKTDVR